MKALGHPIVGDASYNDNYDPAAGRMMLHAMSLCMELDGGACVDKIYAETEDPFPFVDDVLKPHFPSFVVSRRK